MAKRPAKSIRHKLVPVNGHVRGIEVRLYPTRAQAQMLRRAMGAKRYIINKACAMCRELFADRNNKIPGRDQLTAWLTQLKREPESAWLNEIPADILNQALSDHADAWKRRKAKLAKTPRFRKFGRVKSLRFALTDRRTAAQRAAAPEVDHARIDLAARKIRLTNVGWVKFRCAPDRPPVGDISMVTVKLVGDRWFAVMIDRNPPIPDPVLALQAVSGVDFGLTDLATFEDGAAVPAPKHLAAKLKRLKTYQRRYNRKLRHRMIEQGLDPGKKIPKGTRLGRSRRQDKLRLRLARQHAKVANQRKDTLHKLSRAIVDRADVIGIEDLSVKGMARTLHKSFRRSVADAGLGELRRQVTYKAERSYRVLVVVDRFFPSSKLCSACGHKNETLTLADRRWTCGACGATHRRDENAAINIRAEALRVIGATAARSGESESPPAESGAVAARGGLDPVEQGRPCQLTRPMKRELVLQRGADAQPTFAGMEPARVGSG